MIDPLFVLLVYVICYTLIKLLLFELKSKFPKTCPAKFCVLTFSGLLIYFFESKVRINETNLCKGKKICSNEWGVQVKRVWVGRGLRYLQFSPERSTAFSGQSELAGHSQENCISLHKHRTQQMLYCLVNLMTIPCTVSKFPQLL